MTGIELLRSRLIWGLALALVLIALPLGLPSFWVALMTEMLIWGLLAMSLDILLGYAGMPSFGHAAFFGAAAYVGAILSTRYGMGFWLSGLSGVAFAIAVALLFGLLVAHATGVYFLMITFALGMCLWGLAMRWTDMTGADMGIYGIPRPEIGLPLDMYNPLTFYFFTLVIFALASLCLYILVKSPFGQSLKGIRESESRMRVLGYHTWLHRYMAFVIAGAFAGVAGVLWAYCQGGVSPGDLDFLACMRPFIMCILGGPGTMLGPAIGSGIYVFLEHFISAYTQRWQIFVGVIFILVLFYAPMGLVNWVKLKLSMKA
jgi:branched-chain amino acid transport system permease protein